MYDEMRTGVVLTQNCCMYERSSYTSYIYWYILYIIYIYSFQKIRHSRERARNGMHRLAIVMLILIPCWWVQNPFRYLGERRLQITKKVHKIKFYLNKKKNVQKDSTVALRGCQHLIPHLTYLNERSLEHRAQQQVGVCGPLQRFDLI